ncbi:hypothetical protein [Chamaesiphon sp.]|uniref:hypothetical protein n=1 Tax=Chamaesiphon sp. TaxID=2814140 RepID=UPI0035934C58
MNIRSLVFKDVIENDAACLLYLIDKKICQVIPDVDLMLVVEEIEVGGLNFFPKFYPELLTSAWNYSFRRVANAAIASNTFANIERTMGLSLYWSAGLALVANLVYPFSRGFQIQLSILIVGTIVAILAWRRILDRRSRVCADRLTIVCYLMERNLDNSCYLG